MKPMKIILLEDDPIIYWDLSVQLTRLNYQLLEEYLPLDEYLDKSPARDEDIIITNLKLDDDWIDKDCIDQLNSLNLKVVILTGLSDQRYHDLAELKVPYTLLFKPYTHLQIKRSLQSLRPTG